MSLPSQRSMSLAYCLGLFVLLLSPVIPVVYQAFLDRPLYDSTASLTLGNFTNLFHDQQFATATVNTLWFGLAATVISMTTGLCLALVFERINLPFRRTLRLLFLAPIFISPLILSFAWSMLYGPGGYVSLLMRTQLHVTLPNLYSIAGMSLIAGISQAPVSYLFFAAAAGNIPDVFERSARAAGAGPLRSIFTIVIPLLKPALLHCGLLNFMMAVDLLAVPLIIGEPARIQVLATYLYTKGLLSAQVDYGVVAAAAICMIAIVQFFVWLQGRWVGDSRRYATIGSKSSKITRTNLGMTGITLSAIIAIFVLLTTVIPTLFLALRSFSSLLSPLLPIADVLTLQNYNIVLGREQYVRSISNTFIIASVGGVAALALTFVSAVVAYRTAPSARWLIEQMSVIPRAVPGLVIGLGFFYAVMFLPGGEYIRQTVIVLIIAFSIRYFPTGFGALAPAFQQISTEMERAVRVSGGSWFRSIRDVTLPLTKVAMIGAFMLYFVQFFKEYSSAAFLFGPGTEVIGTTMLQLNLVGDLGALAALAVIQLLITVPLATLLYARG